MAALLRSETTSRALWAAGTVGRGGGDIDVELLCNNPLRLRAVHCLAYVQAVCMWAIIVGSMDGLGQRTISRNVGSKSPTKVAVGVSEDLAGWLR